MLRTENVNGKDEEGEQKGHLGDGAVLGLEEALGAITDGVGDVNHLGRALVLGKDPLGEVNGDEEAEDANGEDKDNDRRGGSSNVEKSSERE